MARKIEVEIVGNTRDYENALNRAQGKTKSFGTTLAGLGKASVVGAAIGGIALLGKGLLSSVSAAKEAEQAQTRLESALASANISYSKHGAAIDAAIQKTSQLAALDDEDLSDAFAKLVRTTGDVTKATEGMALAADIARARNISLEASTKIVEKASVGITKGLKGIGVELDKGATATEALEAAQKKFGGAAERYGQQATASQERLGVAFENLQEKVGQKLLPILQELSLKLIALIAWAEKNWPKFAKSIQPVIDQMDEVWKVVQKMWAIIRPILEVALPAAFILIGTQIKVMVAVFETMEKVVTTVITTILKIVDKFLGGIQAVAEAASHLPFVGDKFKGVAESIGHAREKVRELATSIDNLHGKDIKISTTLLTVYQERHETLPGNPIGRRAGGGPVSARTPYMVGEEGPEVFVPGQSGTILPNGASSGGGGRGGWPSTPVIVTQLLLDGKVIAEAVRRENTVYQTANAGVRMI